MWIPRNRPPKPEPEDAVPHTYQQRDARSALGLAIIGMLEAGMIGVDTARAEMAHWGFPMGEGAQSASHSALRDSVALAYRPAPQPRDAAEGVAPGLMDLLRGTIREASAEQLSVLIALIFTQIRESGYTLSAPMDGVLHGQASAWRILDETRQEVASVRWSDGEWRTRG